MSLFVYLSAVSVLCEPSGMEAGNRTELTVSKIAPLTIVVESQFSQSLQIVERSLVTGQNVGQCYGLGGRDARGRNDRLLMMGGSAAGGAGSGSNSHRIRAAHAQRVAHGVRYALRETGQS